MKNCLARPGNSAALGIGGLFIAAELNARQVSMRTTPGDFGGLRANATTKAKATDFLGSRDSGCGRASNSHGFEGGGCTVGL